MKNDGILESLSLSELNIMLEHLRLGVDHLKKYLTESQFTELLTLGKLTPEQIKNTYADEIERAGNLALMANTILTCVLGAWLGLTGFFGLRLGSPKVLVMMISVSILISGFLGYYNYKVTKKQAKEAVVKQKLSNVQLNLLKLLTRRQQREMEKIIQYLNDYLITSNKEMAISLPQKSESKNWLTSKAEGIKWLG